MAELLEILADVIRRAATSPLVDASAPVALKVTDTLGEDVLVVLARS